MKKILFVANVGKEHILKFHIPTIKKFKDEGWQVDVICAGEDKIPYCDNQIIAKWKRSPFNLNLFKGIIQLKEILNNNYYDVVYCHTPVGGLVARIAAKKTRKSGTKVVYFAHGFHFYKGAPLINWLIYYPVEKYLAKYTDKIITINAEDYQNAQKKLKCKDVIQIDGMGIDVASFENVNKKQEREKIRKELNIPTDAWVMIYLAELIPNKNQKMALDALKILIEKNKNTYLILAGIDHYHGQIQSYAKKIGVDDHLKYLGWRTDKAALYASSDVCTATSIREGFGLNLVEALASGLPIVATLNRGHETIIKNGINGYLVKIGDFDSMAKSVEEIMNGSLSTKNLFIENIEKYDQNLIVKRIYNYVSK